MARKPTVARPRRCRLARGAIRWLDRPMAQIVPPGLPRDLAAELRKAGIPFQLNADLDGVSPDFLITLPDGKKVTIEAKSWKATPPLLARAERISDWYEDKQGADSALLVVEGLKNSQLDKGLVAIEDLAPTLKKRWKEAKKRRGARASIEAQPSEDRLIFAAMPFHKQYLDTFMPGMVVAANEVGAACKRLDKAHFSDDTIQTMKSWLRKSVAVIADLSGSNANVLYEVGYAHALRKPTIHLTSTGIDSLPFDVKTWPTVEYEIGAIADLQPKLIEKLKEIL